MNEQEFNLFDAIRQDDIATVQNICAKGTVDLNQRDSEYGYTPLGAAVFFGFTAIVEVLCQEPSVEVNCAVDGDGASPLFFAAREGLVDIVKCLCSLGNSRINVNGTGEDGRSPLNEAAAIGHILTVMVLCETPGVDLNQADVHGRSPLCSASRNGHLRVVEHISAVDGVDVNHSTGRGETPLIAAAKWARFDVVEYLCGQDAVEVNKRNNAGETALHIASRCGLVRMVKILLQNVCIDLQIKDRKGRTPFDVAVQHCQYQIALAMAHHSLIQSETVAVDVNKQYQYGDTLLHMAVKIGNEEELEYLCRIPGVKNVPNKNTITPFDFAVMNPSCPLSFLLHLYQIPGAALDDINHRFVGQKTLLHIAAEHNNIHALKQILLKQEVDIDAIDEEGNTALHYASMNGNLDLVRLLTDTNRIKDSKRIKNKDGDTPLNLAMMSGNIELLMFLFEANEKSKHLVKSTIEVNQFPVSQPNRRRSSIKMPEMSVNRQFENGDTLLHRAVISENEDMVRYLCSIPGAENVKNDQGQTPFDLASKSDTCPLKFLLYLGFLPGSNIRYINQKFRHGKTLLHIAVEENDEAAVRRLCDNGRIRNDKDVRGKTPFDIAVFNEECPQSFILQLYKVTGANLSSIHAPLRGTKNIMHLAVEENDTELMKSLIDKTSDFQINCKDSDGMTILQYAVLYRRYEILKLICSHRSTDINVRCCGESALSLAVKRGYLDIASYLLAQRNIEVNYNHTSSCSLCILNRILEEKLDSPNITETNKEHLNTILVKYFKKDEASVDFIRRLKKILGQEDPPILTYLSRSCQEDFAIDESLQNISLAIINVTVKSLQKYAEDKELRFVLMKRHVLKILLHAIKLEAGNNDDSEYLVQLLKLLYLCLQVNNRCDLNEKQWLKKFLHSQKKIEHFKDLIIGLARLKQAAVEKRCTDTQLIATHIYATYIQEESRGYFHPLTSYLSKVNKFSAKILGLERVYHKCSVRGYFYFIPCFIFIGLYIGDFVTDFVVGYFTLKGFSSELGIFMITLVVITLIQENIRSYNVNYENEKECLRLKLHKKEITREDWELHSNMHVYHGYPPVFRQAMKFCWPFRVTGTEAQDMASNQQSARCFLFNLMSLLMLRPARDQLILLTHCKTNIREFYRLKSDAMSQRQYYTVIEQIPELICQFYLFLIFLNNTTGSGIVQSECIAANRSHIFNYSDYFECTSESFGLKVCISPVELCSMIIPLSTIPLRTVSLEKMFRILNPAMPRMSTAASVYLYIAYIMMVPSRLFLYSALIHTAPKPYYVFAYIALATITWTMVNCYEIIPFYRGISEILKDGRWLSVLVFSIRDIWLISLRKPIAYIEYPSKMKSPSLRSWKTLMLISLIFFVEGVVGAIYIEYSFPCGMNFRYWRYQGWIYLAMLVSSVTMMTLISYTLDPRKMNILHVTFRKQSILIGGFGLLLWLVASTTFLIAMDERRSERTGERVAVAGGTVTFVILLVVRIFVLNRYGEARKKKKLYRTLSRQAACDGIEA